VFFFVVVGGGAFGGDGRSDLRLELLIALLFWGFVRILHDFARVLVSDKSMFLASDTKNSPNTSLGWDAKLPFPRH